MARRAYGTGTPGLIRGFWARVSVLVLLIVSIAMLLISRTEGVQAFAGLHRASDDVTSQVMRVVNLPFDGIRRAVGWVGSFWNAAARVRTLEAENQRLRQWESLSRALHAKLLTYEQLLAMQGEVPVRVVSARLVAETHGPFVRSSLLRVGTDEHVTSGQAVVVPDGMIGRVVSAGKRSARVLLLTDLNSRVPVMLADSKERAILAGDNTHDPRLEYLHKNAHVTVGERVVTSGDDGILPEGIAVGEVMAPATPDDLPRVQLYADLGRIDYVQVLGLQPPGSPPQDTQTPKIIQPVPQGTEAGGGAAAATENAP